MSVEENRFLPCILRVRRSAAQGDRFRNRAAFTLIELATVIAMIAILAAIAVPNFLEAQTRAKIARASADMRVLGAGLEAYMVDYGDYPWNLSAWDAAKPWAQLGALWAGEIQEFTSLTTPNAYVTRLETVAIDAFGERSPGAANTRPGFWFINRLAYNRRAERPLAPWPDAWLDGALSWSPLAPTTSETAALMTAEGELKIDSERAFAIEPAGAQLRPLAPPPPPPPPEVHAAPEWTPGARPYWLLFSSGPDRTAGFQRPDAPALAQGTPPSAPPAPQQPFNDYFRAVASPGDPLLVAAQYDPSNGTVSKGLLIEWGPQRD